MTTATAIGPTELRRHSVVIVVVALVLGGLLIAAAGLALRSSTAPAPPPPTPHRVAQLEALVRQDPGDVVARLQLGHVHFEQDRYDLALEQYLSVLKTHPDNVQALTRAGWIAFEGGDDALAQRLLDHSLDLQPNHPEALWYIAQVHVHGTGDDAAAIPPLRALLKHDDLSRAFRKDVRELLATARGGS